MGNILWTLFKAFRYLFPFMREALSVRNKDDPEDIRTTYNLRRFVMDGVVRAFILLAITIAIGYSVMPIYTENAYLRNELQERDATVAKMEQDLQRGRDMFREAKDDIVKLQNLLTVSQTRLQEKLADLDRLSTAFRECREENTEFKALLLKDQTIKKTKK